MRSDIAENIEKTGRKRMEVYKVQRMYFNRVGYFRTLARGLSLAQAQAWCSDPETSSSTCRKASNKARTRRLGPWFDSYTEDK